MTTYPPEFAPYLAASPIVAAAHPEIRRLAAELQATGDGSPTDTARRCFEYVRDQIRHSWDYRADAQNPLTCAAPQVLAERTGYCYAKSHLLAALLRANGIPAGLCYQRLSVGDSGPPYCLHGLNAVWLEDYGWYRIDARGNKPGVDAQFCPPVERRAFQFQPPDEVDLPEIWPDPLAVVVQVLSSCATVEEVYENLPGVELVSLVRGSL